jgi:hypothetical protein
MRKRSLISLYLLLILSLIVLPIFLIHFLSQHVQTKVPNTFYKTHILGGFSIDTPERATKAATYGVQVVFNYGNPPTESAPLGQKLRALQMKVVDGYISSYLHYYECHRTKELMPSLLGRGKYCSNDAYPYLNNENALLATITTHLKQVKNNQLIIGYWVLDDWVQWDAGSARQILIKIHKLIQQYTPGRPAICGFGGSIGVSHRYGWNDWIADNFSPQGCDSVGFYIYTPSFPPTIPLLSPDSYNWSMTGVLPAMFASLQKRGWDITNEPLIGIGQAFGGSRAHTDRYWVTPTTKNIETQSRSFCEHGAAGLTFFAWDSSEFGPTTHTPMNSSEIELGIRNGIAACKQYWSQHTRNEINSHSQVVWDSLFECLGEEHPRSTSAFMLERSCSSHLAGA